MDITPTTPLISTPQITPMACAISLDPKDFIDIFTSEEEVEKGTKPVGVIITPTGLTEVRRYAHYTLVRSIKDSKSESRVFMGPMLPQELYDRIVAFFKAIHKEHNSEVVLYVWTDAKGKWEITVPEQEVSGASAKVVNEHLVAPEGMALWGHIHSHNTMNEFFSSVDDHDERQDGLVYGVIGKITERTPPSKWRLRAIGQFFGVEMSVVVQMPEAKGVDIPKGWMDAVSKFKPKIYTPSGQQTGGHNLHGSQGGGPIHGSFQNGKVGTEGFQRTFGPHTPNNPHGFVHGFREVGAGPLRQITSGDKPRVIAITDMWDRDKNRPIKGGFQYLLRLDDTVCQVWSDGRITKCAGMKPTDLTRKQLKHALIEGVDWDGTTEVKS